MSAVRFISSRLNFRSRISVVCIAVSFIVMIVAVAVSSGFRKEIRDGVSEISGDVQIVPVDMNYTGESSPIGSSPSWLTGVESLPSVDRVVPVVYRAGIVKNGDNIHGVVFKGLPMEEADTLASLAVSVPDRLAEMLSLEEGSEVPCYFVGERLKVRKFHVASIYRDPVGSTDAMTVYARMDDLQRLNGWDTDKVSAFEVRLKDRFRSVNRMNEAADQIGYVTYMSRQDEEMTVVSSSAAARYPQLFDWLNLIDFNVLVVLALMTVVAGFNMISGVLIMLFENISTIGILKAAGMKDKSIAGVFLAVASRTVLKGMVIGNLVAFALCLLQHWTHLVKLDPDNYFVSFVPVHLDVLPVLLADLAAYLVIMLLLLVPSLFIARVDPAKTVSVR